MRFLSNFGCKMIFFYALRQFLASARFQLIVLRKHWSRDLYVQVAYDNNNNNIELILKLKSYSDF